MDTRTKLHDILCDSVFDGFINAAWIDIDRFADYLLEKCVTVLPEGAIILTRKEIAALNEYQKKLDAGGVADGGKR